MQHTIYQRFLSFGMSIETILSAKQLQTKQEDQKMKTSVITSMIAFAISISLNAANPGTTELNPSSTTNTALLASLNYAEETVVEMSDWMFNEKIFETENKMIELEDWMFDVDFMVEPTVIIEEWMLDHTLFDVYEETFMNVEEWMLDENAFQQSEEIIPIEAWMLDANKFSSQEKDAEELVQIEDWMLDVESFR